MALRHPEPSPLVADAVRSQLNRLSGTDPEDLHALRGSVPAELSMEAPHEVYTLGLDQLASDSGLASARPGGWRYLLQQGNQIVASAQTTVDETGAPMFALFNSGPFVQSTADALGQAERIAGEAERAEPLEPRLLHVPALHAMALWLHGGTTRRTSSYRWRRLHRPWSRTGSTPSTNTLRHCVKSQPLSTRLAPRTRQAADRPLSSVRRARARPST